MVEIGAWLHDDAFGWKARIGVINPSAGITFDHEWARMLPKGISYHVTRLLLERGTAEALDFMAARAPEAASLLKTSRVQAVCYGCTIGSLYRGYEDEMALATRISAAASAPAVMMADSAAAALKSFNAKRIVIANPYTQQTNEWVKAYLTERGFDVGVIEAMAIPESWEITKMKPQEVYDLAVGALRKAGSADAVFLSCGNMRTIDVIDDIERETGLPVISSNQAMLWKALRAVGFTEPFQGFGRLLSQPH